MKHEQQINLRSTVEVAKLKKKQKKQKKKFFLRARKNAKDARCWIEAVVENGLVCDWNYLFLTDISEVLFQ